MSVIVCVKLYRLTSVSASFNKCFLIFAKDVISFNQGSDTLRGPFTASLFSLIPPHLRGCDGSVSVSA